MSRYVGGVACADDVEAGDEPGDGESEDLSPGEMCEGWVIEGTEDGEGGQHAGESGCDGCEGRGFGDGDLGPHVEEAGEVAVGVAEKGVLATVLGAGGGDLRVGHRAEESESRPPAIHTA